MSWGFPSPACVGPGRQGWVSLSVLQFFLRGNPSMARAIGI